MVSIVSVGYDPETGDVIKTMSNGDVRRSAGSRHSAGYRVTRVDSKVVFVHRLAAEQMLGVVPPGHEVDHINGDRADNRWVNLRVVTPAVNMQNLRKATATSASGLLGASPHGDKWCAFIKAVGKTKYLGIFRTAEEAHQAYLTAKRELHEGCTI